MRGGRYSVFVPGHIKNTEVLIVAISSLAQLQERGLLS